MKVLRRSLAVLATAALAAPAAAQTTVGGTQPALGAFGGAVAVAGDQVLVGEPRNVTRPGMVYVYSPAPDGTWRESGTFTAPEAEAGDGFGASLAVDGDRLLVGAEGVVHLFQRAGERWSHAGALTPESSTEEDERSTEEDAFGAAVALSGEWAVVGAPETADRAGAAHLFRSGGTGWTHVATLRMEGAESNTLYGQSVALAGDLAVIGAVGTGSGTGAVEIHRLGAQGPALVTALQVEGGARGDAFGAALAFDGETLMVGAPNVGGRMGTVYLFGADEADGWKETGRLLPFDGGPRMSFGVSVQLTADAAWVGAPGAGGTGTLYRFQRAGDGSWSGVRRIVPEEGSGFAASVAVSDDVAVVGLPRADYGAGRAAILRGSANDEWTVASEIMSEADAFEAVTGGEVACSSDGRAAAWDCSEVDLVGFLPAKDMGGSRGVRMNDVWGWTDPDTGREYALAGMMDQTSFVDVTDPANPVYVGRLPLTPGANPASWRDMKVHDDHVFVVADGAGQHGMQVFDLTRLRDFDGTPETYEPDVVYDNVASVHNIVINEETGMAAAVGAGGGGETCGGGLHMIDIGDPKSPTFAGCFADPQTGRASTGYSHDAQCVIYNGPDERYQGREICLGSNETALSIADVTDRENPVALSRASYPNVGYSHQGWLTEDQRYFYMNDELDELQGKVDRTRTLIWDVTDLEDPQLVDEHFGTTGSSDHNLYIVGDRMYQSNYQSGLRILDISDPESPREIAHFDTVPYGSNTPGFGGSWSNYPFFESGVVIVTSGNEGLFILRPTEQRTIS